MQPTAPARPGLNAFQLKLLMTALMVLDHLHAFLPGMPDWFHWLGRLVAPCFCFLMTESLRHTRDRAGYVRRLTVMGLLMFAGNLILMAVFRQMLDNGIFLSLAASAGIVLLLERWRQTRDPVQPTLAMLLFVAAILFCEGGPILPVLAVVFYWLHGRPLALTAGYLTACALTVTGFYAAIFTLSGLPFHLRDTMPQMLMVFAIVPILLYNGARGRSGRAAKWFFYWFYPLHIWALYLLGQLLQTRNV